MYSIFNGISIWWIPIIIVGFVVFKTVLKIYIKDAVKKLRKKDKANKVQRYRRPVTTNTNRPARYKLRSK